MWRDKQVWELFPGEAVRFRVTKVVNGFEKCGGRVTNWLESG